MDVETREPEATTAQLILAWTELARVERQIRELRARATDDDDHGELRALEDCRSALLRIATRRMPGGKEGTS